MRLAPALALTAALVAPLTVNLAAMDNPTVVKMKNAGLTDDTIMLAMQKEKPEYDTSTDGLIALKRAGISEAVIQKMLKLQLEASAPPAVVVVASPRDEVFYGEFPSIAPPTVVPVAGQNYFTRYSLHEEDGKYISTNYARGTLVPINTPVTLVALKKSKFVLKRLDTGAEITVENADKYTRKNAQEFAGLLLSSEKTPLDKLPAKVAEAVANGEMRKGMTKELVLLTRGYPPAHVTPSTDSDRWVYWSSRFVQQTIVFADGRLSEGRGIN